MHAPPPSETTDTQAAPKLSVSGQTLTWKQVGSVTHLRARRPRRRVSRLATRRSAAPRYTPSALPGATVHYSVRTAVEGSAWSPEVAISYPEHEPAADAASDPPNRKNHSRARR